MDASRNSEIDFSPPVLQFDFTYLVPVDSEIHSVSDADRPGVRIVVVRNHASTLCLNRLRKQAELVEVETPEAAFSLLLLGRVDAWASTRPALLEYSAKLAGSRVLGDYFGANFTAMTIPKGHRGRLAYIREFVEEAKSSGLVHRAILRSGWRGVHVAPPGYATVQKRMCRGAKRKRDTVAVYLAGRTVICNAARSNSKSELLAVTTVAPWRRAVSAINVSFWKSRRLFMSQCCSSPMFRTTCCFHQSPEGSHRTWPIQKGGDQQLGVAPRAPRRSSDRPLLNGG
jgi:hypothetical protein